MADTSVMLVREAYPVPRRPRMRSLIAGQMLCEYGDPPGPLYIVISGKLLVFRPNPDNPDVKVELAQLGPGAIVGELASMLNQPRTASVGALDSTTVLEVSTQQLERLTRLNAPVARVIVLALHDRGGLSPLEISDVIARWGIEVEDVSATLGESTPSAPLDEDDALPDVTAFYSKSVTCPACQKPFPALVVRPQRDQPVKRESDFHQLYAAHFNPYDYELWVCPNDLYAGLPADFGGLPFRLRKPVIAAVEEVVQREWGGTRPTFGVDRSLALREQGLLLALAISRVRSAGSARVAALLHRLAWCARERADAPAERAWMTAALEAYTSVHEQADRDTDKDKEDLRIQYLCGELALRLGDRTLAHRWFSNALQHSAVGKHAMWARMLRGQLELTASMHDRPDVDATAP